MPASAARTEGLILVFDGGAVDDLAVLRLPPDELAGAVFAGREELPDHLPVLQARRASERSACERGQDPCWVRILTWVRNARSRCSSSSAISRSASRARAASRIRACDSSAACRSASML